MKFKLIRQHTKHHPRFTLRKDGSQMIVCEDNTPCTERMPVCDAKRLARRRNQEEIV